MARTRTWSTTIPVDHTQIKNLPDSTRDLREDLEERVDGILAGFVNTGATNGLLLGRLLTVGTNNALTPGTGTAGAYDIYCLTTGSAMEMLGKDNAGNITRFTNAGKIYAPALGGTYPCTTQTELANMLPYIYPIGCIYTTTVSTNPNSVFGFGTWAAFGQGRFLLGDDGATYIAATTGGTATHTLTTAEIPAHNHTYELQDTASSDTPTRAKAVNNDGVDIEGTTNNAGGGGAHNNMPPYVVVYFWKRTA